MTPLRQRFIEDMRLRNMSLSTIESYVLRVAQFAKHFGKSPEVLGPERLREYPLGLIARKVSWSQFNQAVCALRLLYNVTLGRPDVITHLPFAKRPRVLPTVLSPEEAVKLLESALPGRDRTLLLPVEYHHVVFTLPAEIAELALSNQKAMYTLLFQAASATLRDVAANPKWFGAMVGVTRGQK